MKLNEGLIVSCQALKNEPMYGGDSVSKFALAAYQAGAKGIRANTVKDINKIYKIIDGKLPIIGIIKAEYKNSKVYITPTLKEVKKLIASKCDVIALDATLRVRPNDEELIDLVNYIKEHSSKLVMADCATLAEAQNAEKIGFDYISTTLRSYTKETAGIEIPDIGMLKKMLEILPTDKVIFEGGIDSPQTFKKVLETGVKRCVIGGAITRPLQITKRYLKEYED
jgi:N-acylglucosamine-6-phosphate 2-epimerase